MERCLICREPVSIHPGDTRLTDTSWDEEVCFPHEDMTRRHITDSLIGNQAALLGAPRPTGVIQAMRTLIFFEEHAPDNARERDAIHAAKQHLRSANPLR